MMRNLIFDLDGTLINSEEGIRKSLHSSFLKAKLKMSIPQEDIIIGPPLDETIRICNNELNENEIEAIKINFKKIYDNELFKLLYVYPNVENLLESLFNNKISIYIGTNKRFKPTNKILKFLSWDKLFKEVYAINKFEKNFKNKTQMLEKLLEIENISADETLYIGDKFSDFISANNNKISFIGANWGNSDFESFNKELTILNKLDKQNINFLISLFKN
tara:strand:+ start:193 stop:849 length:657 start_codon:yes stop_codon:yes gene_type:complete